MRVSCVLLLCFTVIPSAASPSSFVFFILFVCRRVMFVSMFNLGLCRYMYSLYLSLSLSFFFLSLSLSLSLSFSYITMACHAIICLITQR